MSPIPRLEAAPDAPVGPSPHSRSGWRVRPAVVWTAAVVAAALTAAVTLTLTRRAPTASPGHPAPTATVDGLVLPEGAPQWKYVGLAVAEASPPLPPLPAPGRVDFDESRTASVGAPLAGRVEEVRARLGDRVKKGDRLFSIRSGAWADLEKETASAREAVAVKGRMVQRIAELVKLTAAPEKDLIAAEAELREAQLALKAAAAKRQSLSVAAAGENLFWVTAPRDGTVVAHDVFASQEVTPDRDTPLLRISDLDEVWVIADVGEADAAELKAGAAVKVRAQGADAEKDGAVERVAEVVDQRRRTVEVRVRVANADRSFRPNGFVEVSVQPEPELRRVHVPSEAVVTDGERSVIFVAREGGRLQPVRVSTGRERDRQVEIRTGLEPGTRYVSKGALLLLNQVDLAQQ